MRKGCICNFMILIYVIGLKIYSFKTFHTTKQEGNSTQSFPLTFHLLCIHPYRHPSNGNFFLIEKSLLSNSAHSSIFHFPIQQYYIKRHTFVIIDTFFYPFLLYQNFFTFSKPEKSLLPNLKLSKKLFLINYIYNSNKRANSKFYLLFTHSKIVPPIYSHNHQFLTYYYQEQCHISSAYWQHNSWRDIYFFLYCNGHIHRCTSIIRHNILFLCLIIFMNTFFSMMPAQTDCCKGLRKSLSSPSVLRDFHFRLHLRLSILR